MFPSFHKRRLSSSHTGSISGIYCESKCQVVPDISLLTDFDGTSEPETNYPFLFCFSTQCKAITGKMTYMNTLSAKKYPRIESGKTINRHNKWVA